LTFPEYDLGHAHEAPNRETRLAELRKRAPRLTIGATTTEVSAGSFGPMPMKS
jgi:hypothetical protein